MIDALMTSQLPINQDSPIVPAFGQSRPISSAVDKWYSNWHQQRNPEIQRASFPAARREHVTPPTSQGNMSLHAPPSTAPSAQGPYVVDFGKMSPELGPRAQCSGELSYIIDFGPRTPPGSHSEEFVIDFGTRDTGRPSHTPSPKTPKDIFVIDFGSNNPPTTPTPPNEFILDFGSRPEEQFNIDFGRKSLPASPMQGIVVDFGSLPASPSPSPMNIVIDFPNVDSPTSPIVDSPQEEFIIEFEQSQPSPRVPATPPSPLNILIDFGSSVASVADPHKDFVVDLGQLSNNSPPGPRTPPPSPYLIHFGTRTTTIPGSPQAPELVIPSSGSVAVDGIESDFNLPPPFLLFEPDENAIAMSQFAYDFELNQVVANMEASVEPVSGLQSPLHRDFLGVGPDSSPPTEPAEPILRSPIIHAALRYGYKTGPEKRSLPTFIDQYVSANGLHYAPSI